MYIVIKKIEKGDLIKVDLGKGITEEVLDGGWRAETGGHYWFVGILGIATRNPEHGDEYDNYRHSHHNYFRTEKECKDKAKADDIYHELRGLADWKEGSSYYIVLSYGDIGVDYAHKSLLIDSPCFDTIQSADQAIKTIGKDRLKWYFNYIRDSYK